MPTEVKAPYRALAVSLAKHWGEFVDCRLRLVRERPFLLGVCGPPSENVRVLDCASGIGCEAICLAKSGFSVTANEIDSELATTLRKNAREAGVRVDLRDANWLKLSCEFSYKSFDVLLVLGNSLCLVRSTAGREKCLREFFSVLNPKGKLIIDERNFQYILDEREEILRGNFRYSGKIVYCGHIVSGRPIAVSEENVKFRYFHRELGCVGTLNMYPFRKGELRRLLYSVGFSQVQAFPDFGDSSIETCDFVTYVAVK